MSEFRLFVTQFISVSTEFDPLKYKIQFFDAQFHTVSHSRE